MCGLNTGISCMAFGVKRLRHVNVLVLTVFEPGHEKTYLNGFQPILFNYPDKLKFQM